MRCVGVLTLLGGQVQAAVGVISNLGGQTDRHEGPDSVSVIMLGWWSRWHHPYFKIYFSLLHMKITQHNLKETFTNLEQLTPQFSHLTKLK